MTILKFVVCLFALFAGTFFTTFVLTGIETKSAGFRAFTRTVNSFLPRVFWTAVTIVCMVGLTFFFLTHVSDYARAGIFAGLLSGIPMYFRSGVTVNQAEMERIAKENEGRGPKNIAEFFAGPESVKDRPASENKNRTGYHAHNGSKKKK